MKHAAGKFDAKTWDEKPLTETTGAIRLTRAAVTNAFHGDIEADGVLEYLLFYRDDKHGTFIGMERITGRLGDRRGSFVLQHEGTFEDRRITDSYRIVPGSGTGDLRGITGKGSFTTGDGEMVIPYTLDYDFA